MKKIKNREIEKVYTMGEFVKKLRRLADSLEKGKKFSIQVAGEKINVPKDAIINIEHEKNKGDEEVEFQIKWKN
jgi:amphi-Trp domain-containing protein